MAQSRLATVIAGIPQAQWDRIRQGRTNDYTAAGVSEGRSSEVIKNRDGNVVAGNFGVIIFVGYQTDFVRPTGGTLTPANTDRMVYIRQPNLTQFSTGWELEAFPGSTPRIAQSPSASGYERAYWRFGGGGNYIGVYTGVFTTHNFANNAGRGGRGTSTTVRRWITSSQNFSDVFSKTLNVVLNLVGSYFPTFNRSRRADTAIYGKLPYLYRVPQSGTTYTRTTRQEVGAIEFPVLRNNEFDTGGERFTFGDRTLWYPGVDLVSIGDGATPPGTQTTAPVVIIIGKVGLRSDTNIDSTLRVVLASAHEINQNSAAVSSTLDSAGWTNALPDNTRKFDVVADGSTIWAVHPDAGVNSTSMIIQSAPQPTSITAPTFVRRTSVPPFPHSSMTSTKILNVWLCETQISTGRRLGLFVEFWREPDNPYYRDYPSGSIQAPIFYITGDYSTPATLVWDTNGWQPLIPPASQRQYSDYFGSDVTDGDNTILYGVTKHGLNSRFTAALMRVIDRSIMVASVEEFQLAPNKPVNVIATQDEPAIITQKTANSYIANADFPLKIQWTYSSPTGGQQYAYRLTRRLLSVGTTQYWNGSSWIDTQDVSSIIIASSLQFRGEAILPVGWARNAAGQLIEDEIEYFVQTFSEAGGIASPVSDSIVVTPAEAIDPIIITPAGAYNNFDLIGLLAPQRVASGGVFKLPDTVILSRELQAQRVGLIELANDDFNGGSLLRVLSLINNFTVRIEGTLSGSGRVRLHRASTLPSGVTSASVVASTGTRTGTNAFTLVYNAGNVPIGEYFYVSHDRASETVVELTGVRLSGRTGYVALQADTSVLVTWAFGGTAASINEAAQAEYQLDLYEGEVVDFANAVPLTTLRRTSRLARNALVRVFKEGTYTVRLFTIGQTTIEGLTGLQSRSAYAIFQADLVDPAVPDTQTVELCRITETGEATTRDLPINGRGNLALLYTVRFPESGIPFRPGVPSVYGGNNQIDVVTRQPWPNGSNITEWQFRYNNGNDVTIDASSYVDPGCPGYTWRTVQAGRFTVQTRCRNAAGWSQWSNAATVEVTSGAPTRVSVPVAPPAPRLELRGDGRRMLISMCDPVYTGGRAIAGRQARYRIRAESWTELLFEPGEREMIIAITPDERSGRVINTSFGVQVRVFNEEGPSPWSAEYRVDAPFTRFAGAIPERSIVWRRDLGDTDEGIPVAELDVTTADTRAFYQYVDVVPNERVDHEYRSQLFTPDAAGSSELVEIFTSWAR